LRSRKTIWSLLSIPNLREYLIAINDEFRKTIVLDTISQFESQVLSRIDDFDQGIIHGDYNEQNIIVQKKDDCDQWFVNGVIDFGDAQFAPKIFDLAIFLTYTMLECKSFDPILAPGFGISGYLQFRKIKANELKILFVSK
jgi:hydroxylysine kinase